jgi:ribosome-associated toxin RatA of RatAB toxin-antitoxin module
MARISASIDIEATPAEILSVIADVPTYPQWSAVHKWASVDSRFPDGRPMRASMGVSAVGLTDTQVLDYEWSAHGVSWSLVKPTLQQKDQRGGYSITEGAAGVSHVHCELHIDPAIPLPGLLVRQVMKKAVTAGTDGLKRRVESRH